ncbi:16S rRNA (adenine(1518)-N(6)/adenine(1519)-N(6))-dimethyltransferase RsmA [Cellvibrio sp. KY-GH-1]|uniref:16S rRNA (adenine(1518)-N(6)/adenine(1519)-N(6))- dimethyltransferase RsmA n=1 Tax=Cellvibrio sp. KY-GH-1 TaxID=2303332 RepID=UPI00124467DC|nr:16S rRNA (adenine(1518)-N(6)/adenine(1519)-N(6))-dimethyltransferase RsmA [Cellvibrio sp. KY-GH-1]QEY16615.1 16S rRNA (adenine(1518)-N(6)/adenine(1519)-N(6))-dimethyltransferase RsmA [Cellvibrio sp. KY-GH-1]
MKKMLNHESQHKARKRFGQNFLIDHGIIRDIVRSVHPHKDDVIVEIGPGKGAITQLLADACDNLNVIELDRDLVPWLKVKFEKHPNFQLYQADALQFDFAQLMRNDKPLRIVGNLPYNISTPLIFHLLSYASKVQDMHFMLQKEVVKRMAAQPGESAYGRLGIMVQYYCAVEDLFDVPPTSFDPAPKVDSAIVRLIPYKELPFVANNIKTLETLVNVAFQQRRKTLRNSLKQLLTTEQMESLPVDLSLRPEEISLPEYVAMSNLLGEVSFNGKISADDGE